MKERKDVKTGKRMKILLSFLIASAIFLFLPKKVWAANLLINPGFEEKINSWSFVPQTATFSATQSLKHGGNYAALLTKIDSLGWAYFSQKVNVETNRYYKLSAWLMLNDSFINNIKLRFYWLDSSETKISSTPVEKETRTINSAFQFLETESSLSPSNAYYAEIQGYVYLTTKNPANPAIFDDLVFEELVALTSTPTPTVTDTPTPKPTPTSSSTPTPTKKPIPTLTPTPEPAPSEEIFLDTNLLPTPTIGEQSQVLGTEDENKNNSKSPLIFIGLGALLIIVSAGTLLIPKLGMYNKKNESEITEIS